MAPGCEMVAFFHDAVELVLRHGVQADFLLPLETVRWWCVPYTTEEARMVRQNDHRRASSSRFIADASPASHYRGNDFLGVTFRFFHNKYPANRFPSSPY